MSVKRKKERRFNKKERISQKFNEGERKKERFFWRNKDKTNKQNSRSIVVNMLECNILVKSVSIEKKVN